MRAVYIFLALILFVYSVARAHDDEHMDTRREGKSLSLLPAPDCVITDPCKKCTSENKAEPACKSTGYLMEYACNKTQIEGNSTVIVQEFTYAACRKPLEVMQTDVSLLTVTAIMYAIAIIGTIILFVSRNMKWLRGYRRVRVNSVS